MEDPMATQNNVPVNSSFQPVTSVATVPGDFLMPAITELVGLIAAGVRFVLRPFFGR
jgi:hypothetical protein